LLVVVEEHLNIAVVAVVVVYAAQLVQLVEAEALSLPYL